VSPADPAPAPPFARAGWWLAAGAWTAGVLAFTLARGTVAGRWIRELLGLGRRVGVEVEASDALLTLGHLGGFLGLGLLYPLALTAGRWRDLTRRAGLACVGGLVALGGALELAQLLIPGRGTTWDDFAANAGGAAVGVGLVLVAARRAQTRSTTSPSGPGCTR